ncbi:hypothetical protein [Sediminispirochaeta smaragdinae]|uniref:OmpA family protein n=1 Tax=Sediminispirochaeta smaragdinae (strain DSM 11293 / JCM 15392 / SEBR 4228) TaxID=573413 RepID=E1R277_SEDSS|nr:hypothetical protein [Sediminispirochaeta smaragdinae]ADK81962.1 OmpA family protein [Sediminispirochaeta smaragdinae DSM 11293]
MRELLIKAFLSLLCILPVSIFAAPVTSSASFPGSWTFTNDWGLGILQWKIELPIGEQDPLLPSTRKQMEREIDRAFPSIFLDTLLSITIDSSTTIGDAIEENPGLRSELTALAQTAERQESHYTTDLSSWRCSFELHVYPEIARLFINHTVAYPPNRKISLDPGAQYTGILIYVEDRLPVHGLFTASSLRRGLFPRIFDEEMNPVIDRSMVDPGILSTQGMVLYLPPERMKEAQSRVGQTPLRITARELYGRYTTDMLVTSEASGQILSNDHNIGLIEKGRIAVICNEH